MAEQVVLPEPEIVMYACKMAIEKDKEIKMDYWLDSQAGAPTPVFYCAMADGQDPKLARSEEEYTSNIVGKFGQKGANSFIVETENSYYIVSKAIQQRVIG